MSDTQEKAQRIPPSPLPIDPYFRQVPGCEPFLHAIAEDPDDDTTRLVFADWLEDQGHGPRAELIHLQCKRTSGFRQSVTDRERQLLKDHGAEWTQGLEHLNGLSFSRGMLEVLPLSAFVALSEEDRQLLDIRWVAIDSQGRQRLTRLLEEKRLEQIIGLCSNIRVTRTVLEVLATCHRLLNVRHLDLANQLQQRATPLLDRLPFLAQLDSLNLDTARLGTDRLLRLLKHPHFPTLKRLELRACQLRDPAAEAIAESQWLSELTHLDLSVNYFQSPGGMALAKSSQLNRLTHLNLSSNKLGAQATKELSNAKAFPSLVYLRMDGHEIHHEAGVGLARIKELSERFGKEKPDHLDLAEAGLTKEAVRELLASPLFDSVTSLNLRKALVHLDALAELVQSPRFSQIARLDLSWNKMGIKGAQILASSEHCTGLKELNLQRNGICLEGAAALVESPFLLKNLERLDISQNQPLVSLIEHSPRFATMTKVETPGELTLDSWNFYPDNDFAWAIASSPYLADFTKLTLRCWNIDNYGIAALARSPNVAGLTHLTLTHCLGVRARGFQALVDSPHLENLDHIEIISARHPDEARAVLQKRWPRAIVNGEA